MQKCVLKPLFPADGTTVRDDWVFEGKVDMNNIVPLYSVCMRKFCHPRDHSNGVSQHYDP